MANAQRLLALADFIERDTKNQFDMGTLYTPREGFCGGAACIAGHGAILWPEFLETSSRRFIWNEKSFQTFNVHTQALADHLGMTELEEKLLFFPGDEISMDHYSAVVTWENGLVILSDDCEPESIRYSEITRAGAVATLRRFAATGEIVWKKEEQI